MHGETLKIVRTSYWNELYSN